MTTMTFLTTNPPNRLIIDMAPPMECSPNWRGYRIGQTPTYGTIQVWRAKAAATKHLRNYTAALADGLWRFQVDAPPVILVQILWPKGRKTMDRTNAEAALKPMIDGLTDAGWWPDDKHVTVMVTQQLVWGKIPAAVRVWYPQGAIVVDIDHNPHEPFSRQEAEQGAGKLAFVLGTVPDAPQRDGTGQAKDPVYPGNE